VHLPPSCTLSPRFEFLAPAICRPRPSSTRMSRNPPVFLVVNQLHKTSISEALVLVLPPVQHDRESPTARRVESRPGDKVFGERTRTRLLTFQYDYVLHVNDYFPKAVRGTSLQRLFTATSNKVPPRLACLIQGITAHRLTPSTVPPLGTY
jgi:hypothetical protein